MLPVQDAHPVSVLDLDCVLRSNPKVHEFQAVGPKLTQNTILVIFTSGVEPLDAGALPDQ